MLLLLLLLSRFSRVRLCATPEMAAHQVSPSLGFSRQEHWSGLPFPCPVHESEQWKWSRSVVSYSSDPMDCSLPGSSVHGIFQGKVLEWGAIAFYKSFNLLALGYLNYKIETKFSVPPNSQYFKLQKQSCLFPKMGYGNWRAIYREKQSPSQFIHQIKYN